MLIAASGQAQLPLPPGTRADAERLFDQKGEGTLDCGVETRKPFLDFSFRYEVGYLVHCGLAQFQGRKATLGMLLRVKPVDGTPTFLGQSFAIPSAPEAMKGQINFKRLHAEIQFSGVYAAGQGTYENELAIVDEQNRVFRKKWRVRTEGAPGGETSPMSLAANTVESISLPHWDGAKDGSTGLRLTVLLDAAPFSKYSATLHAWDRAFLLGAVSSVLRQLPLASVRLVAFNLDQQREIFRQEHFDTPGLARLASTLAELELKTISYKTLAQDKGWQQLLTRLVREECDRKPPSDAVVFIGITQSFRSDWDKAELTIQAESSTPIFYFEYSPTYGAEFPDVIERLTKKLDGSVYRLHSPEDLANGLDKMRKVLRREQ